MNNKFLITSTSAMLLASLAGSVSAIDNFAQTSRGNSVVNSYGECWQSAYGAPGLCGGPVDTDGDGVTDDKDKCPGTPKGVQVDMDGCPLASDGDGVYDYMDKCPGTPKGAPVDAVGCPLDSDGDGVYDYMDKCPGTPNGAKVDSDGCMEQLVLRNVTFELDKAQLTAEAEVILRPIADVLKGRPDIKQLTVVGHTDSSGSDAYNRRLSEERAQSVAGFFRAEGVSVAIKASGMGESSPVADNSTAEGREQNRRVELGVMK